MYVDIVFPEGNEEAFLKIAGTLGYKCLVFVYEKSDAIPKSLLELSKKSKIKIQTAIIAEEKQIQKAKKTADVVIVKSTGNDRWVLEKSSADIMFGLEEVQKKDFMHHRGSGLNQVLCKIAASKKKKIAFDFSAVLNAKGMLRAQIIGKMMQNIRFCRKYKVRMLIASFAKIPYGMRSPEDLTAFFTSIGMHPKEAKDSLSWTK